MTGDPARVFLHHHRRFGTDAVRWWLLREVAPNTDTDFTARRLVDRANLELANGLGNLVNRTLALVRRAGGGLDSPAPGGSGALAAACRDLPGWVDAALARFDFRAATGALCSVVAEGNRFAEAHRPWELARAAQRGNGPAAARLDAVLAELVAACRIVAGELGPFLPGGAGRLRAQLLPGSQAASPAPVFPRLDRP